MSSVTRETGGDNDRQTDREGRDGETDRQKRKRLIQTQKEETEKEETETDRQADRQKVQNMYGRDPHEFDHERDRWRQ